MEFLEESFIFENDCDALKNNIDYKNLMKTFSKLQSQRIQAVQRLEMLHETREKFISNPRALISILQRGENLDLPFPIKVVDLPEVDWNKYDIEDIVKCSKPKTRKKILKEDFTLSSNKSNLASESEEGQLEKTILVRGRLFDETKPQNFNQPWSLEEQRKLEELLLKYPDEPTAAKRWAKIAKELGTRTSTQVNSRIQKYFIALKKEGLPVPGKNPRSTSFQLYSKNRKKFAPSRTRFMKTFDFEGLKASNSDQYLAENFKFLKDEMDSDLLNITVSDEEDILDNIKDSKEYFEYMKLKKIKKMKQKEIETGLIFHPGFECSSCGLNPINGTRWHCIECSSVILSYDLCTLCRKNLVQTETHLPTHTLTPINALSVEDTLKVL